MLTATRPCPRQRDPTSPQRGVSAIASPRTGGWHRPRGPARAPGSICSSRCAGSGAQRHGALRSPPRGAGLSRRAASRSAAPPPHPHPAPRGSATPQTSLYSLQTPPMLQRRAPPFLFPVYIAPATPAPRPRPCTKLLPSLYWLLPYSKPLRRPPVRRLAPAHSVCFKGVTILINSIIIIIIIITRIIIIIEIINKDFFLQPGRLKF